jgi:succinate dehydrogenase / fumarate reductase cytochrome b subunit
MHASSIVVRSFSSSVFLKAVLAVSGGVWVGFLTLHLYSNLHLFLGPEAFDTYYAGLKESPAQLWAVRAVLLVAFVAHVSASYVITKRNLSARPQRYRMKKDLVTNYAARTMRWTGPIVGLYIVYNLLHLSVGIAMPAGLVHHPDTYYANVVRSFQVWYVAFFYVLANAALGMHLAHGISSMFQSLGLARPEMDRWRNRFSIAFAVVLCGGFASLPIAVWIGVMPSV